ncbi:MAG TPA: FprA family A-type flavoprotein [Proteobacteria bacterium]|nr:FprA family A-type flavoprotein [Pseudomonadota bacterium]
MAEGKGIVKLAEGVYWVGAIHWDRRLFDELIPTPEGTSYNAYMVFGSEKTALIDTVDPATERFLFDNLEALGVKRIDYLIANHAEQDHSGTIPKVLEAYAGCKVVANEKCKSFLKDLLLLDDDDFVVVGDGERLSLGDRTLEFVLAPWVHWPETMLTYLHGDGILFPCDLFGSHLATSEMISSGGMHLYASAKRYYAEIMMPFRAQIQRHMEKLSGLDIRMIAPSHGPIYSDPGFIMDAYRDWISDDVKNEVVLPWVSMHGSTARMVEHLIAALMDRGIVVKPFNLTVSDVGELAMALVDAATVVIAAPTMLVGPHPSAVYAAYLVNALRPKTRFVGIVGSYGWGSRMVEVLEGMLTNLKAEKLEPVIVKGHPKEEDFRALDELADSILEKHRGLGIA